MIIPNVNTLLASLLIALCACGSGVALGWHLKSNSVAAAQLKLIAARDALQNSVDYKNMQLAEMQRAAHERKDKVVVKYETKWLEAPASTKQSCVDSGLFEYTDSILGVSPNGATGETK